MLTEQSPLEKYQLDQCIGKGNFGDVYKAHERASSEVFAIKILNLDESSDDIKTVLQEIEFLSKLKSPYITRDTCRGLKYLHDERKVHRDIKLANILLTQNGGIKLADFGVSGEITLTQAKKHTFVGTPYWMAPEVITTSSVGYNQKADIWSLGITTIELVTGKPPLSQIDPMDALFEIPKNEPPCLEGEEYSDNIKDFIKYCLKLNHRQRPNAATESRKPRHEILKPLEENTMIEWDFNTKMSAKTKQSSVELKDWHQIVDNKIPYEPNHNEMANKQQLEISKDLHYNEAFIYCLQRVLDRARNPSTKLVVNLLIRQMIEYENQQPGLSEAIIEELLNFKAFSESS
ncbi:hypothetical protein QCA50_020127 [Cerrena zonata]|uniref:non-specific serine/threonine protein kinase n=1 Tax=Cerrena zonata TaxID=2478898 RepID=A0AAW0FCE8_9APHY